MLFFTGYVWMLIIPSPYLGRETYIDENALQPGQVNTYWDWGDVHAADKYLEKLEALRDTNSTRKERSDALMTEFVKLGLSSSIQNYTFSASTGVTKGTNVYGILSSPRAPGLETIVISASWLSRTGEGDGNLNLRGVSTVLALARFLKRYSLWAKDIIFVVSDGYLEGMHAWLAAYHGSSQSNLEADRLELTSGVIWTAVNIDYPGHSFSHLGIFFEGNNGRLPNQDLLNSFQRISRYTGGVPVVMYDHLDPREHPDGRKLSNVIDWIPKAIQEHAQVQGYAYEARNVLRHLGYQARGRPSGVHGLFHKYRVDAFTLFALPAAGPHGFHAIGRVVESTLRTVNNLLERLHASFFFYILTSPDNFLKIGSYLPSAVLISIAMIFGGLKVWVDAGWICHLDAVPQASEDVSSVPAVTRWSRRQRPVLKALSIMIITHFLGATLFTLVQRRNFIENRAVASPVAFVIFSLLPSITVLVPHTPSHSISSISSVLKALNLCLASTVISITTVLNFSLAASLAISLGIPLSISSASDSLHARVAKYTGYMFLALGWLLLGQREIWTAIWHWEILSVWFAPFVSIVYVPLVLQAGLVCLLPP